LWRQSKILDQLPIRDDVGVVVIERPPMMRRRGQDRTIAAFGRCYEWARLVLKPHRIITPLPSAWMQREKKAERGVRLATEYPRYAELVRGGGDRGHDVADAIGLGQWYVSRPPSPDEDGAV